MIAYTIIGFFVIGAFLGGKSGCGTFMYKMFPPNENAIQKYKLKRKKEIIDELSDRREYIEKLEEELVSLK